MRKIGLSYAIPGPSISACPDSNRFRSGRIVFGFPSSLDFSIAFARARLIVEEQHGVWIRHVDMGGIQRKFDAGGDAISHRQRVRLR